MGAKHAILAISLLVLLASPAWCAKDVKPKKMKEGEKMMKGGEKVKTVKKKVTEKMKAVKKKVTERKCRGTVTYTVETECMWSRKNHPVDYPKEAFMTPVCGTVHSKNYFLWRLDDQARNGAKDIAEMGDCSAAMDEIKTCQAQRPPACQDGFEFECSNKSGTCQHVGEVTATPAHTYLSFQGMLAPSPDWSVGLDALDLCVKGKWIKEHKQDLYALDMGTDMGTTFKSEDMPNGLRRPIAMFDPKDKSSIFFNKKKGKTIPICKLVVALKTDDE